jgi:hypothetical protein
MEKSIVLTSYPKLDLDFKPQSLDSKNLDWDLVWEPQAARGSRPGPGAGLETPIFGFEEPGLRPGLGTSSCNRGAGLQTLNLGFEEEEEEDEGGWDMVREPEATHTSDICKCDPCVWLHLKLRLGFAKSQRVSRTDRWSVSPPPAGSAIEKAGSASVCLSATCGFCHRKGRFCQRVSLRHLRVLP